MAPPAPADGGGRAARPGLTEAVRSPFLAEVDRYERALHGWIGVADAEVFQATVRLADPWVTVELEAHTTPSPEYGLRQARVRVLAGGPDRIDPALEDVAGALAGLAMTAGFTRRVAEALGPRPGAGYVVDAALEVARLARQVTRLDPALVAAELARGPLGAWRLDLRGWADLPASCFTYRPESEALFAERAVTTPMSARLYGAAPGSGSLFHRTKVARLERRDGTLHLSHSMFDEVHAFQLWLVVDPATGLIREAGTLTPRLPYMGICSEPQGRLRALVGERLDANFRRRLGVLVGGREGCAQLYDLTADLLRLLSLD